MGEQELSATRLRNKKRRQSRKGRNVLGRHYELGGVMVKTLVTKDMTEKDIMRVWVDEYDVGVPNGGYTDAKWRAECEEKSIAYRQEKMAKAFQEHQAAIEGNHKAKARQVGGDHYKEMGVEPWDVVDTWPMEQRIGAYRHGALKYLMRMGSKDEQLQEIKKAGHYIEKLIEVLSETDD